MPVFVVERFLPSLTVDEVRAQASREREVGGVRHIRTIYLPADELCFVLVEATSLADVRLANQRAELACERITEAIDISDESLASP